MYIRQRQRHRFDYWFLDTVSDVLQTGRPVTQLPSRRPVLPLHRHACRLGSESLQRMRSDASTRGEARRGDAGPGCACREGPMWVTVKRTATSNQQPAGQLNLFGLGLALALASYSFSSVRPIALMRCCDDAAPSKTHSAALPSHTPTPRGRVLPHHHVPDVCRNRGQSASSYPKLARTTTTTMRTRLRHLIRRDS